MTPGNIVGKLARIDGIAGFAWGFLIELMVIATCQLSLSQGGVRNKDLCRVFRLDRACLAVSDEQLRLPADTGLIGNPDVGLLAAYLACGVMKISKPAA